MCSGGELSVERFDCIMFSTAARTHGSLCFSVASAQPAVNRVWSEWELCKL